MAKKSNYKSKNNVKGLLPFLLLFAVVGILTVIISFAQPKGGGSGSGSSDPGAAYTTTDKLRISPANPTTGQQFSITYDKLVNPKGTLQKAQSAYWSIQCFNEGNYSGGSMHANAYMPNAEINNLSGRYTGTLNRTEYSVSGELLECYLNINAYSTPDLNGPLVWDRIHFKASVAP